MGTILPPVSVLLICAAATASPSAATALQSLPVPGEPARAFRVEIAPCQKPSECPYQVSLVSRDTVLATRQFDWMSATPSAERTSDTSKWGSGDLIVEQSTQGWTSGEEERFIGVIARPIQLTPSVGGVVVDFIGGFEHLKREHFVLAAVADGLVEAWHEKDGPGPTWSSTAVTNLPGGQQGLVFFHGADVASDSEKTPDVLDVQVLAWSDKDRTLEPQTREGRAFAIVFGPFGTIGAATKSRESQDTCVGAFSIRPAKDYGTFARGFVLVRLTSSSTAAKSTFDKTRQCLPKLRGAVVGLK
jgi:hypothetical protein